jgi:hypothetical protein
MAAKEHDRDRDREQHVGIEDVMEVGSRVGWGAILAGAVMALATSLLLGVLGAAVGLTASDAADGDTLAMGAGIWAIVTTIVALFVGGFITSQCVVGETKTESVVHGIIMWGVTFAMLMWFAASGISAGFGAMMQVADVGATASQNASHDTWQRMAQTAGVSQEQIEQWTTQAEATAKDPEAQRQAAEETQEAATHTAWWTLGGLVLSIAAAVGGALLGAGPTFRLLPIHVQRRSTITGGA